MLLQWLSGIAPQVAQAVFGGVAILRRYSAGALPRLPSMTLGARPLRAHGLDKVVHQLGWIKSIQFGGHFMGIEQGYFEKDLRYSPVALVQSGSCCGAQ